MVLTIAIIDSIFVGMAQLLVRKVEEAVVERLREEAARERISVEEAHRRVLRRMLLPGKETKKPDFKEFLARMPLPDKYDYVLERQKDPDRPIPDFTE